MKPLTLLCKISCSAILVVTGCVFNQVSAQQDSQQEKVKKFVTLRYFNDNNKDQYLLISAIMRTSAGISPQDSVTFAVYMDEKAEKNLLGKYATSKEGLAKYFIPPALKEDWDSSNHHTFIAIADEGTDHEQSQEIEIQKSRISIDTLNEEGVRNITARVMKLDNGEWVPVPDVEMKIGVRRLGGVVLSGGDDPTYSTDENGDVKVEFTKTGMPGDEKGDITLEAKVEDNDDLGNLIVEKVVPWGVPEKIQTGFFDQRTLWSTRFRTPFWLLAIAYSIVVSVWGTLIYLVFQLVKVKKLGKNA